MRGSIVVILTILTSEAYQLSMIICSDSIFNLVGCKGPKTTPVLPDINLYLERVYVYNYTTHKNKIFF